MRLSKRFHLFNLLLLACAMACLVCYDVFGGLWLKGFTSLWFVLVGMTNVRYARLRRLPSMRFVLFVLAGLLLGLCADVLLGVHFLLGMLAFALGHGCYLAAFCALEKPRCRDALFIVPLAVLSIFIVTGLPVIRIDDPLMHKLVIGYAVIIACMLGKAASNAFGSRSRARWMFLAASLLFWFSDLILAIDLFGTSSRLTWILCSYAYWPSQNLLAYALFHHVNEESVI